VFRQTLSRVLRPWRDSYAQGAPWQMGSLLIRARTRGAVGRGRPRVVLIVRAAGALSAQAGPRCAGGRRMVDAKVGVNALIEASIVQFVPVTGVKRWRAPQLGLVNIQDQRMAHRAGVGSARTDPAPALTEQMPGHGNEFACRRRTGSAAGNTRNAGTAGRHGFTSGGRCIGNPSSVGQRQDREMNPATLRVDHQIPQVTQGLAVLRLDSGVHEVAEPKVVARIHRAACVKAAGRAQTAGAGTLIETRT